MKTVWTPELERRARDLKASGMTSAEIGEAIGVPKNTVIRFFWLRGLGGGKKIGGFTRDAERAALADAYHEPSPPRRFSWEAA